MDYLEASTRYDPTPVTVVAGGEAYLRRLVLDTLIGDYQKKCNVPHQSYVGEELNWRDLASDLVTGSLFGPTHPRLLIVDEADSFVSANRSRLERYATQPSDTSLLVLSLHAFASNTKLYKIVCDNHRLIVCQVPQRSHGFADDERIVRWLQFRAKHRHQVELTRDAAMRMVDLVGREFGVLDQELARLSVLVWPQQRVGVDVVAAHIGSWRLRTGWEFIKAVASGDVVSALPMLDRLLQSDQGDVNLLFGQMSWSLRQFAAATRFVQRAERAGQKITLHQALSAAGVRYQLDEAVAQLRQIGRARGSQLYQWLMQVDLALKGSHARPDRARWALEKLMFQLAKATAKTSG